MADRDFLSWLAQRVKLAPFAGYNEYGEPAYGADAEYPARVVGKVAMVRDAAGLEKVSTMQVYIADPAVADAGALVKARLTLPDGSQPPILAVSVVPDEKGQPYYVLVYT